MTVSLDDLVNHAAFELAGMHPDDQAAVLAAACEAFADYLHAQIPWVYDAQGYGRPVCSTPSTYGRRWPSSTETLPAARFTRNHCSGGARMMGYDAP